MRAAANILQAAFDDSITVNIGVGYGEIAGRALSAQNRAQALFSGGPLITYTQLRSFLSNTATSADDVTSVATLPNTPSLQGHSSFTIAPAQAKVFGLLAADSSVIDGQVGIGTAF